MMKTFVLLLLSGTTVGLGLMLWLCYCAGRWGKISLIGAEMAGFSVIIVGMLTSLLCLRNSRIIQKMTKSLLRAIVTVGIIISILVAVRAASFNLLLRTYAAGFEKTALDVAPIPQWQSLLPLAQTFLSDHKTNRLEKVLPPFVMKVYQNNAPYCFISGDLGDLNVVVLWRQPTVVIGIIIGGHGSMNNELYRKHCADDIAVVVAR